MGLPQIRKELHDFIDNADEKTLKMVHAAIQASKEEEIVGYTTAGEPLTKYGYNKRLEEGVKQFKEGKYTTQEDLENESEDW